jgi:hypothetical protein
MATDYIRVYRSLIAAAYADETKTIGFAPPLTEGLDAGILRQHIA